MLNSRIAVCFSQTAFLRQPFDLKITNKDPPLRRNCEEDRQWLGTGCMGSTASHHHTWPVIIGTHHHTWFPCFCRYFSQMLRHLQPFSSFMNHLSPCDWPSSAIFQSCVRFVSLFPAFSPSIPDVLWNQNQSSKTLVCTNPCGWSSLLILSYMENLSHFPLCPEPCIAESGCT